MLPRRRVIGGVTERSFETESDSYSKLDKKGFHYSEANQQYSESIPQQRQLLETHVIENDPIFEILEKFVFEPVMASRDRTNEFISTVRSLQGRSIARPSVRDERKAVLETYSQFMSLAKVISKSITSTYAKLEKLALCKLLTCF